MNKLGKILLGGVLAVSLAFNVVTIAASTYEYVTATIDYELKMKLNGATFEPREADGSAIRPLLYKGRTYLPVAALGEALGVAVGWDGDTRTVSIGEGEGVKVEASDVLDTLYFDDYTIDKEQLYISGKTFDYGLVALTSNWNGGATKFGGELDLKNNNHQKLFFAVASEVEATLKICDDETNMILKSVNLGNIPQDVEVDVGGIKRVRIEFESSDNYLEIGSKLVVGDLYWK